VEEVVYLYVPRIVFTSLFSMRVVVVYPHFVLSLVCNLSAVLG
jgi:hypothetical protein